MSCCSLLGEIIGTSGTGNVVRRFKKDCVFKNGTMRVCLPCLPACCSGGLALNGFIPSLHSTFPQSEVTLTLVRDDAGTPKYFTCFALPALPDHDVPGAFDDFIATICPGATANVGMCFSALPTTESGTQAVVLQSGRPGLAPTPAPAVDRVVLEASPSRSSDKATRAMRTPGRRPNKRMLTVGSDASVEAVHEAASDVAGLLTVQSVQPTVFSTASLETAAAVNAALSCPFSPRYTETDPQLTREEIPTSTGFSVVPLTSASAFAVPLSPARPAVFPPPLPPLPSHRDRVDVMWNDPEAFLRLASGQGGLPDSNLNFTHIPPPPVVKVSGPAPVRLKVPELVPLSSSTSPCGSSEIALLCQHCNEGCCVVVSGPSEPVPKRQCLPPSSVPKQAC